LAVSEIDDRTLLDKSVSGDAGALEALMARHAGRVYRLAYGITRNPADAEEVVQDVFLTVVRKGSSFEGQAALATWMYRVTMNAALNRRRGKRRELEVSLEEHLPTYTEDGHRAGDRSDLLGRARPRRQSSRESRAGSWRARSTACPTTIAPCSSSGTSRSCPTRRSRRSSAIRWRQ
jgi:RNA polymerase sigma factor (sigma-70 family)